MSPLKKQAKKAVKKVAPEPKPNGAVKPTVEVRDVSATLGTAATTNENFAHIDHLARKDNTPPERAYLVGIADGSTLPAGPGTCWPWAENRVDWSLPEHRETRAYAKAIACP